MSRIKRALEDRANELCEEMIEQLGSNHDLTRLVDEEKVSEYAWELAMDEYENMLADKADMKYQEMKDARWK